MPVDLLPTLLIASAAAFGLALLSAVAGFGGGVLLLPVFTALSGCAWRCRCCGPGEEAAIPHVVAVASLPSWA